MNSSTSTRVAVIGASPTSGRYSNTATKKLLDAGYEVVPVNPATPTIHGIPAVATIADVSPPIHTVTMYVNPHISDSMIEPILQAAPQRIVFNPGAENPRLAEAAAKAGIEVVEACTLVMLSLGQF